MRNNNTTFTDYINVSIQQPQLSRRLLRKQEVHSTLHPYLQNNHWKLKSNVQRPMNLLALYSFVKKIYVQQVGSGFVCAK